MLISTVTGNAAHFYGDKAFDYLASVGFKAIDYSYTDEAYSPFTGLYAKSNSEFDRYFMQQAKLIRESGLIVGQAHAPFPTWPESNDPHELAFMLAAIKRSLRAASILGGKYLVIHCAMLAGWGKDPDPKHTEEENIRIFSELLKAAHEYGVPIALENMPLDYIPSSSPEQLVRMIDTMNDPDYFVACLDTGHANLTQTKVTCADFARALGSRLKCLHIHDNKNHWDEHACPFTGNIDWPKFMQALNDVNYAGTFSLETSAKHFPNQKLYDQYEKLCFNVASELICL